MTYLLDTNVCIAWLRSGGTGAVAARMRAVGQQALAICSIVVTELLFGAHRSNNVARNLAEVRRFASGFVSLASDDAAAEKHAEIWSQLATAGTIIGPLDLQIAA